MFLYHQNTASAESLQECSKYIGDHLAKVGSGNSTGCEWLIDKLLSEGWTLYLFDFTDSGYAILTK